MGPRLDPGLEPARFSGQGPVSLPRAGNLDILDASIVGRLLHPQPLGLQFDVRISYADVARSLGVDEETVRTRLKRLQEEGFVQGWGVSLNPALLGRTLTRFETPPVESAARDKVRAGLAALDGAMWVFEYHSGAMAVVQALPPGPAVDRNAALIRAFAGGAFQTPTLAIPRPTVEPTALDWRLIQALRHDPRRPYAELAGVLGASEKTLRRRLDALTEGQALLLNADIDSTRVEGGLPVSIHVQQPAGPGRAEVDRLLRGRPGLLFYAADDRGVRASHLARGVAELEPLRRQLEAVPGVQRVGTEFQLRRLTVDHWVDEELARRLGGLSPP